VVVRKDCFDPEIGPQFKQVSGNIYEATHYSSFVNGKLMAFIVMRLFHLQSKRRLYLTDWATAHNTQEFRAAMHYLNFDLQIQPGGTTSISAILDDKRAHGILKPFFMEKMGRVRISECRK